MALHYDELALLVNELQSLRGGQVQRVLGSSAETWHLQIRIPGITAFLEIALDPIYGRVCLRHEKPISTPTPSSFTMLLRKWLIGGRLASITLDPSDRIVRVKFQRGEENASLVVELLGGQQNAILLHKDLVLHVLHNDPRCKPGTPYSPPVAMLDFTPANKIRTPEELRALTTEHTVGKADEDTRETIRRDLNRALKRIRKRAENIERDLRRIQEAEALKHRADLLQTVWGKVVRGQKSVTVLDYADDMKETEILLDPTKTLENQVAELYHTYKRLKRAKGLVEERLLETLEEVENVQSILDTLDSQEDDTLKELSARLQSHRSIPRVQSPETKGTKRRPYREFRTSKGRPILVGRSAKDNDALTSRVARGNDVWMHARDWSGSHVILKTDAPPDGEDLLDAAILAAHFSKGRNDTNVEVTWTYAKHVRRVKGGAPGKVTVAGGQTLLVSLEASRLKRLLESEVIPT